MENISLPSEDELKRLYKFSGLTRVRRNLFIRRMRRAGKPASEILGMLPEELGVNNTQQVYAIEKSSGYDLLERDYADAIAHLSVEDL